MQEFSDLKNRWPVFAINLKHRSDRKAHIIREFVGRTEFDFEVVEACENVVGAVGLWQSITGIVKCAKQNGLKYVIICEDDHEFTSDFNAESLVNSIEEGSAFGADVILGGASAIYSCRKISSSLIWMESFTGTQFVIVFEKFYDTILNCEFTRFDSADFKLSALTDNIYCIFPFISIQKEFGYSDVTSSNSEHGRLKKLFSEASEAVEFCLERFTFFRGVSNEYDGGYAPDEVSLCTYVLDCDNPERAVMREVIREMPEFNIVGYCSGACEMADINDIEILQRAVSAAMDADEDFVIIIDGKHTFTRSYSKELLVRGIIDAHEFGAGFLLGGASGGFTHALPATSRCFWINDFDSAHFIVLFRKFFGKILSVETNDRGVSDGKNMLAAITSNAFLLFPFISQAGLDLVDIPIAVDANAPVNGAFKETEARMLHIRDAFAKYDQVCID